MLDPIWKDLLGPFLGAALPIFLAGWAAHARNVRRIRDGLVRLAAIERQLTHQDKCLDEVKADVRDQSVKVGLLWDYFQSRVERRVHR